MATMKNNKFFVCGTNAFKPICRHYEFEVSKFNHLDIYPVNSIFYDKKEFVEKN